MNFRLLSRFLGQLSLLIGLFMLVSLVWAFPGVSQRTDTRIVSREFEWSGFWGLLGSAAISAAVGWIFYLWGRRAEPKIYRKEAMAIVGLGWLLATVLGALPFVLSGARMAPAVRIVNETRVFAPNPRWHVWSLWQELTDVSDSEVEVLKALISAGAQGLREHELQRLVPEIEIDQMLLEISSNPALANVLLLPGAGAGYVPADRAAHVRLQWRAMGLIDAMFESQSGFSTTGATVITNLEDAYHVPNCILFWRASTHFLGGLGIIVLFVALLGQGSAGKSLMRAEMPGPTKEGATARMQHSAWMFAAVYIALNIALAIIYMLLKMSLFDALCHSFATMATGGFSTYNASLGHFESIPGVNGALIDLVTIVFMILAATNFLLLYLTIIGKYWAIMQDSEWRGYLAIVVGGTLVVAAIGILHQDESLTTPFDAVRYGMFQVVSILTTTGYCTADFDRWHSLSKCLLFLLMFVGGCSGSTGGGMKVIRHILFAKILRIEIEHSFHPRVVRLLRLGGKPIEDQELRRGIMVYFGLVGIIFSLSWLIILAVEPDSTWMGSHGQNLVDSASAVSATLNNVGPGLGAVGATQNYANFSGLSKFLFIWLMMLGRLEMYPVLVLFMPQFWRDQ